MKQNKITLRKLEKYQKITEKALALAQKNVAGSKKKQAEEILEMVKCYLSDSKHFQSQGNYVNSFAAINYAHGWLDSGARLKIFKVKDSALFTI